MRVCFVFILVRRLNIWWPFKLEGLIDGLIEIAGQTGDEYELARRYAVWAMNNIADGDDEVKAGLFHFPGLMTRIEGILGDATLNGTGTKSYATLLANKLLTWRHSSFRATFETYTLMLKLCSKKHRRADPNPTSRLAVFFFENETSGDTHFPSSSRRSPT